MAEPNLYLVVMHLREPAARRRVRETLRFYGTEVTPNVFEVFLAPNALYRLRKSLMQQVGEGAGEDNCLRVYPVCQRCRERATALGQEPIAEPPIAFIF